MKKITASVGVPGGYFLLENLSTMYITSVIRATTNIIAAKTTRIISLIDIASPPFRGS